MTHVDKVRTAVLIWFSLTGFSLLGARAAWGQETVVYNFGATTGTDGSGPYTGLLIDPEGNLFGTTPSGGSNGYGTLFELSPAVGGGWTESVLHNFDSVEARPDSALIADAQGNLYGETGRTAYQLSPVGDGTWIETTLHTFSIASFAEGFSPVGGLAFDAQGNLYGTTEYGGAISTYDPDGLGTVFELSPSAGGMWTETVLHRFAETGNDGIYPQNGVVIDSKGRLYGTTPGVSVGQRAVQGTVFELTPQKDGTYDESLLYAFPEYTLSGLAPVSGIVFDNKGNLYGTTAYGGSNNGGTVFKLSPSGHGWTEKSYSFPFPYGYGALGNQPDSGVTVDSLGNLYGITAYGGANGSMPFGTAYKLAPQVDGSWLETLLHSFPADAQDGFSPSGNLIFDTKGNLYGATQSGGSQMGGSIFKIAVGAVAPVGTTTTLVAQPGSNLIAGEPITLTATVTSKVGSTVPTGTVVFADPEGGSVSMTLAGGVATYKGVVPAAGSYSVYASYSGGPGFNGSNSATVSRSVTAAQPQ